MTTETITGPTVVGGQVRLLSTGEVAYLFGVDPKTVRRWANTGRLTSIKTLGNQRRFRQDEVFAALQQVT